MTSPFFKKKKKNPTWQLNTADDGWRTAVAGMGKGRGLRAQAQPGGCLCFSLVETPEPFFGSSVVKAIGPIRQLNWTSAVSFRQQHRLRWQWKGRSGAYSLRVCGVRREEGLLERQLQELW